MIEIALSDKARWVVESEIGTNDRQAIARYISEFIEQKVSIDKVYMNQKEVLATLLEVETTLKKLLERSPYKKTINAQLARIDELFEQVGIR